MKVGVVPSVWLKEKSEELHIPFADLLWVYVVEDVMLRVSESSYKDFLCVADEDVLTSGNRLVFFYVPTDRKLPPDRLVAGQQMSPALMELMLDEVFSQVEYGGIAWDASFVDQEKYILCEMTALYQDMRIPVSIRIFSAKGQEIRTSRQKMELPMHEGRQIECMVYAQENRLSAYIFEIMNKLELISDMEAYAAVNDILKQEPVNGRHIMEELESMSQKQPKVLREKRLEQLAGYREYTYMRKRWEQYEKIHRRDGEEWGRVLDRILNFVTPVWTALCRNEVFFDDWMPDLERFLG